MVEGGVKRGIIGKRRGRRRGKERDDWKEEG